MSQGWVCCPGGTASTAEEEQRETWGDREQTERRSRSRPPISGTVDGNPPVFLHERSVVLDGATLRSKPVIPTECSCMYLLRRNYINLIYTTRVSEIKNKQTNEPNNNLFMLLHVLTTQSTNRFFLNLRFGKSEHSPHFYTFVMVGEGKNCDITS